MGDVKFFAAMCSFLGANGDHLDSSPSSLIGSILGLTLIFLATRRLGYPHSLRPLPRPCRHSLVFGGSDFMHGYWDHVRHMWSMSTGPLVDSRALRGSLVLENKFTQKPCAFRSFR